MYRSYVLTAPFFEIGLKGYLYGQAALELALAAEEAGQKYDVQIIITPQYVDIPLIARATSTLHIFAQHMDFMPIGRGTGYVLPEAIKEAGAHGVLLNHAEKRLALSDIQQTIARADEVGLATMVCADTPEQAIAVAQFMPNIVLAESPQLIGKRDTAVTKRTGIKELNSQVKLIDPQIEVLHGAGIYTGSDVRAMVNLGARGTGATSGIVKAANPAIAMEEMVRALREAWDNEAMKGVG